MDTDTQLSESYIWSNNGYLQAVNVAAIYAWVMEDLLQMAMMTLPTAALFCFKLVWLLKK